MNRLHILLSAFVFTLLTGLSTTLTADDTEIYLRQVPNLSESKGRPSILFVLDRTGSMKWKDRDRNGNLLYEGKDRLTRLQEALLQMLTEVQNVNVGFMGFNDYAASGEQGDGNAAILFPITYIDEEAKNVPGELDDSARLSIPIMDSSDDAEEGNLTGKVYLEDKTIEMIYSGDTEASLTTSSTTDKANINMEYTAGINKDKSEIGDKKYYLGYTTPEHPSPTTKVINGLRFLGVGIPQGATIQNASVTFTARPGSFRYTNSLNLKIKSVLAASASNPTSSISSQWGSLSSESVAWNPETWDEGTEYTTPDLSKILQEVVDLNTWKSGNDLGIVFSVDDASSVATRVFDYQTNTPTLNVSYSLSGGGVVISNSVSYPNDNAVENTSGKAYQLGDVTTNKALVLGYSNFSKTNTAVGFRFRNVLVPPKAKIKSATLDMTRIDYNGSSTDLKVVIYGQDDDDTEEFIIGESNNDLTKRPSTSAQVTWEVPNVARDKALITPDFSSIIQEIVDRDGWLSGNTISIIIKHVEGETTGKRQVASYSGDGTRSRGALLNILYEEEEAAGAEERKPETQKIGLRFQNVGVPQGARIKRAYLDFTSGFAATDDANVEIHGEKSGNSEPFSNSALISERKKTVNKVSWDIEPWEWTDQTYSSPMITSVVQEIVNRSDWCGNNAMSFIITAPTGTPLRNVVAFDTDPAKAPVLKVEYDITSVKDDACMRYLFTKQISDANDDAEETHSDNVVFTDSRTLDMTTKGSQGRLVGLRFQNIPMAKGTEVLRANLIFTALEDVGDSSGDKPSLSQSASLKVYGEATGDSEPFTTDSANLSSRTPTGSVNWNIAAADVWKSGKRYTSVDISPVIQEIVSRGAWKAGNALSIFIDGSGLRQASSFDRALTDAPMLQVEVRGSLAQSATTVRERMKLMVERIQVNADTPLVDAIYEVAMYLEGKPVVFGKNRRTNRLKRVSHRGSWKDGDLVVPDGCSSSDPWTVECQNEEITGNPVYVSPEFDDCQKTYIVFLTDGAATANSSQELVKKLIGKQCKTHRSDNKTFAYELIQSNGTSYDPTNTNELCGVDVVEYLHEKDFDSTLEGKQNIVLHTVGFNLGTYYDADGNKKHRETHLNQRAVQYLKDWAAAGGGNFYEAASADELTEIFRNIISAAMTESTSFAAPTLSVNTFNRMYHRNEVYFSLFKPGHTQRWDGNIKKYFVCTGGTCELGDILDKNGSSAVAGKYISSNAISDWNNTVDGPDVLLGGTGERLLVNGVSSRNIYTYIGEDDKPKSNHNIDITEFPVNTEIVTKELLGNKDMEDVLHKNIVKWIQGEDVMGDYDDGDYGTKRWMLADPLHSSPVTITYGGTEKKPISKLFVGTNDGLIRMFDTETGKEEWAFLPQEMLGIQQALMVNAKGARIYGIDGTPSFLVLDKNSNGVIDGDDFVRMYIGMRRGGRNLYALDVTNYKKPKLMWVIKGGIEEDQNYKYLGQTWSRPKFARIYYKGTAKIVLVFGGGYHGDDESNTGGMGNGIYIVDPDTGELLWRAGPEKHAPHLVMEHMKYPIPSDITLVDSNGDAITDRLYVGDIGGQLWRIDFPTEFGQSTWGIGGRLANISDLESNDPQVMHRRRFFYPPEVVRLSDLVYSDTPDYFIVTITSGSRPSPLNPETHDRFYAFRDRAIDGLVEGNNGKAKMDDRKGPEAYNFYTLEEGTKDLYDVTENLIQEGSETEIQAAIDSLKESKGWYLCLTEAKGECKDGESKTAEGGGAWLGEKGLASPVILEGKVFFTTYLPAADIEADPTNACNSIIPEGESRLYALDLLTGGAAYDFNKGNNEGGKDLKSGDRHMSLRSGVTSDIVTMKLPGGFGVLTNDFSTLKDAPRINSDIESTFWLQE